MYLVVNFVFSTNLKKKSIDANFFYSCLLRLIFSILSITGEGPSPEEVLTGIVVNENKVAFKSGYGKYLSVDIHGNVTARADAIGVLQQWEPVFQV